MKIAFHYFYIFSLLAPLLTINLFSAAIISGSGRTLPEETYKPGELLIKFKTGVSENTRVEIHTRFGSEVIEVFRSIGVQHIKLRDSLSVEEAIKLYESEPTVQYAEPVGILEILDRSNNGNKPKPNK